MEHIPLLQYYLSDEVTLVKAPRYSYTFKPHGLELQTRLGEEIIFPCRVKAQSVAEYRSSWQHTACRVLSGKSRMK